MPATNYTRRGLLKLGSAGAAALGAEPALTSVADARPIGPVAESGGCCLTASGDFYNVERGSPLPYRLPEETQREIGMLRETWQLEIVADPADEAKIDRPLLKANGTALTFGALMKLAEKKAVSFLKVITCNNLSDPLGHGMWEGVPLREVLWLAGPVENLRHIYYYGHHNEDRAQMFKCYLPMNRVFEDPPGELPVILCYKLNGEWLTGERGGPVRMIVPEAYGFKSVKWLQRIVFTNNHQADDTYANGNNDINSWLKTFARFAAIPATIKAGEPLVIHGNAQSGISGLTKVQYWLRQAGPELPEDDPHFTGAPWQDASIFPFDAAAIRNFGTAKWHPAQFDPITKLPREWPLRYTLCRWSAAAQKPAPGKYELRCRTIDAKSIAQPMPRPFPKSGRNGIQCLKLTVEA